MTINSLSYVKVNGVNPVHLTIDKINGYLEENNGNNNLKLISIDEGKDTLKNYEEMWSKTRDLIRSTTNNSDDYDKKYMKIKFNSDDDLPLNKTLKLYNMIIVVKSDFHEGNKYYPQVF